MNNQKKMFIKKVIGFRLGYKKFHSTYFSNYNRRKGGQKTFSCICLITSNPEKSPSFWDNSIGVITRILIYTAYLNEDQPAKHTWAVFFRKKGENLINLLINKLSTELRLPGDYQYCDPGTKLQKRLASKDFGINLLNITCTIMIYHTHNVLIV